MYVCLSVCLCMYVSVCMSMYVCQCMYVNVCMSMYVCQCLYVCMSVCLYVCMSVCMYVCMSACMYACMHVCMYACMHVCMYVCMYVYIYIYIYEPGSQTPHGMVLPPTPRAARPVASLLPYCLFTSIHSSPRGYYSILHYVSESTTPPTTTGGSRSGMSIRWNALAPSLCQAKLHQRTWRKVAH